MTPFRGLPDCELIKTLEKKLNKRTDLATDVLGLLNSLQTRVSAEVSQINTLFPEYTPHDKEYHLTRLFKVADKVLGVKLIDRLNSTELFLLACGLYAHDWGMAINADEKESIISLLTSDNQQAHNFPLLDDEKFRLNKFLHKQAFPVEKVGAIPVELWRIYVRETHALRSAARVKNFFEETDATLGQAVAQLCIGHSLDFAQLRDEEQFPSCTTLLDETINLRAVAIYVRLIDLLDITDDRTPYALWKFVSPKDSYSKMEWDKHRAINSLSVAKNKRTIQIAGSTKDHLVYAALEDLKAWCEEQFRGCDDLLAEMNDKNYYLDVYRLDWKVKADGFKPANIRFEFDRANTFAILAEGIYQNDPYVFLRELLQNSIDAIRTRIATRKKRGLSYDNIGVIEVDVEHLKDGDAVITWSDDGIGMNENIIRNYFAVAGRSYYRSKEFENEGLELDPISQFGIGVLSCFAVSEQMEVETYRDPDIDHASVNLKVIVPSVAHHFRVESQKEGEHVGTSIKLNIDGKKMAEKSSEQVDDGKFTRLEVTKYLCQIAGFVEFPIFINENGQKTVILHPQKDESPIVEKYGNEYKIHKLDLTYPWEKVFGRKGVHHARRFFQEKSFDLSNIMPNEGYEGVVSYIIPKHNDEMRLEGHNVLEIRSKDETVHTISWLRLSESEKCSDLDCDSGLQNLYYSVFRDGILIPNVSTPQLFSSRSSSMPYIYFKVNIPKGKSKAIDLSRREILGSAEKWDTPVTNAVINNLITTMSDDLKNSSVEIRLLKMAEIIMYYGLQTEELTNFVPIELWPVAMIDDEGTISIKELQNIRDNEISLFPNDIFFHEYELMISAINSFEQRHFDGWKLGTCFLSGNMNQYGPNITSIGISRVVTFAIRYLFQLSAVKFFSCEDIDSPLILKRFTRIDLEKNREGSYFLRDFIAKHGLIEIQESGISAASRLEFANLLVCEFLPPFNNYFAFGWDIINIHHPYTLKLLKTLDVSYKALEEECLPKEQLYALEDKINELQYLTIMEDSLPLNALNEELNNLAQLLIDFRLTSCDSSSKWEITESDFVPGTLYEENGLTKILNYDRDVSESVHPSMAQASFIDSI